MNRRKFLGSLSGMLGLPALTDLESKIAAIANMGSSSDWVASGEQGLWLWCPPELVLAQAGRSVTASVRPPAGSHEIRFRELCFATESALENKKYTVWTGIGRTPESRILYFSMNPCDCTTRWVSGPDGDVFVGDSFVGFATSECPVTLNMGGFAIDASFESVRLPSRVVESEDGRDDWDD